MRIGELAQRSGLSADAIRFYESQKLLPPTRRSASGYRQFGDDDLRRLNFIRRAKRLGFTLPEIAELLALSASKDDDMGALRDNVAQKLADVEARLAELRRVRGALRGLLDDCPGHGELRDCPILAALGGDDA
ncbi:MAG: heavy metal-responsive transcriptional regulator [Rhodanobacteraceae bacterium]|nr:heavy metal-responsive transcriptional regulator [Xanthomonadales bacterium]MCP5478646.1 heavy metal-responsive transcriptional regulator [Rhodanobacteraceae bacterium]HPF73440.1 heavy metal-responsive transcriptional regulator [Xanthomonadaceae bacterium]HRX99835.1 heavy metal-responsive transcriptional regulator [Xanthomonadaceae bacterium]